MGEVGAIDMTITYYQISELKDSLNVKGNNVIAQTNLLITLSDRN